MLKRLGLYIALFWSLTSQAQFTSIGGTFSINNQRGCRDMPVTVTNTVPPPGNVVVLFLYEGRNSTPTPNTNFTYTTTGNYWLYRFIQNDPQRIDSILVEILDPVIPLFELNACGSNEVQVDIQDNNYDIYEIDYGDGSVIQVPVSTLAPTYGYAGPLPVNVSITGLYTTSGNRCGVNSKNFTPVNQVVAASFTSSETLDNQRLVINYSLAPNTKTSLEVALNNSGSFQLYKNINQGSSIDTLTNLQLNSVTYCFRIASHDACSNFKAYSNTLCPIYADVEAVNNAINLNWDTDFPANNTGVNIVREGSIIATLSNQELNYADSSAICNTTYCYFIEGQHNDGSISKSNVVCARAFSTDKPPSVTNISSTIENGEIKWTWLTPANEQAKQFSVFNQNSELIDTTNSNNIVTPFNDEPDICIQLELTNNCDNISDRSDLVCPLQIDSFLNTDGSLSLNWLPYMGYENGVNNYSMVIFNQEMVVVDSFSVGQDLNYTDPLPDDNNQISYYRVWATAIDSGVIPSASAVILVEREAIIAIPSAFTPNGDNLNDVFFIKGKYIQSVELRILNRWGSTIYQVNGATWDGTAKGKKVPLGNYIYHAVIKDFAGNELIRNGTILILKD